MKILDPTIIFTKKLDDNGEAYIQAAATAVIVDFGNEMNVRVHYMCCNDIQEARNKFRTQLERICCFSHDTASKEYEKYVWLQKVCDNCIVKELSAWWFERSIVHRSFIDNPSNEFEF